MESLQEVWEALGITQGGLMFINRDPGGVMVFFGPRDPVHK